MNIETLYATYEDFADHARNIRGYGDWHCTCKKAFNDFNDWLAVDNIAPVTQAQMAQLEKIYVDKHQEDIMLDDLNELLEKMIKDGEHER